MLACFTGGWFVSRECQFRGVKKGHFHAHYVYHKSVNFATLAHMSPSIYVANVPFRPPGGFGHYFSLLTKFPDLVLSLLKWREARGFKELETKRKSQRKKRLKNDLKLISYIRIITLARQLRIR